MRSFLLSVVHACMFMAISASVVFAVYVQVRHLL